MDECTLDIVDSVETTKCKLISAFNNILRQRLTDCIDPGVSINEKTKICNI